MPVSFTMLFTEIGNYLKAHKEARDATNAAGRSKTRLAGLYKEYMKEGSYPVGFGVGIGAVEVSYALADPQTVVPPGKVIDMWVNGEITREQMLEVLRVGKEDATRVLGADRVATLAELQPGKTVDIRVKEVETSHPLGGKLLIPEPPKPKQEVHKRPKRLVQMRLSVRG